MTDEEKEFHSLTRMEQLRIAEQVIKQLREQLAEMTNDRDRWRDMAHGEPTTRPAWEKR